MTDLQRAINELMPEQSGFWSAVFRSMSSAEEADELIEQFMRKHPKKATLLWDCFMTIQPTGVMGSFGDSRWWREYHAKELLQRVVDGTDIRRPTRLELFIAFVDILIARGHINHEMSGEVAMAALNEVDDKEAGRCKWRLQLMMLVPIDRHEPDVNRWHDRVSLEKKQSIMAGVKGVPDDIFGPAIWEREEDGEEVA